MVLRQIKGKDTWRFGFGFRKATVSPLALRKVWLQRLHAGIADIRVGLLDRGGLEIGARVENRRFFFFQKKKNPPTPGGT